ncbi:hypothetical protein PENTCL1PPCAC_25799, partial [Pristionchus entomophagus]
DLESIAVDYDRVGELRPSPSSIFISSSCSSWPDLPFPSGLPSSSHRPDTPACPCTAPLSC